MKKTHERVKSKERIFDESREKKYLRIESI